MFYYIDTSDEDCIRISPSSGKDTVNSKPLSFLLNYFLWYILVGICVSRQNYFDRLLTKCLNLLTDSSGAIKAF